MSNKKPFYLTIEGCDGSGKTTLVKNLLQYFQDNQMNVLLTKEFGSEHDEACKQLRAIALSSILDMEEIAGQLVFAGIARQHQEKVIKPALQNSSLDVILSDRGIDTNFAYGEAHGLTKEQTNQIFGPAYSNAVLPDITLYLDVAPEVAASRRAARSAEVFTGGGVDRIEAQGIRLQDTTRQNFLARAKKNLKRIKVISVSEEKNKEMVLAEAVAILKKAGVLS